MLDAGAIADALCSSGWWVGEGVLDTTLLVLLASEAHDRQAQGLMQAAGIGRGARHQLHSATRKDSIFWLDGSTPAQQAYLAAMENLRGELNRELMLGLFEFEAHFAHYQPAAYYRKHRDSFAGAASRVVSVVSYLNPDWTSACGGELLIFDESGAQEQVRVLPAAGTVVVFCSEAVPHEVLPASRDRYSIAGWFRLNASNGRRVDLSR